MLAIRQASDLSAIADAGIRAFLQQRMADIDLAWAPDSWEQHGQFFVVEAGETAEDLAHEVSPLLCESVFGDARLGDADFVPAWEWAEDHGSFFEILIVTSDDGDFDSVIVSKNCGQQALLDVCAGYATVP